MDKPIVAGIKPAIVNLEKGKTYYWCACGRSETQPFCDGSHKTTSITPVKFIAVEDTKKAMCMCKQTSNRPFCDGSHNNL